MKLCYLTFTLSQEKTFSFLKRDFWSMFNSVLVVVALQSLDASGHTVFRVLFTSPSSTPNLDRIHDAHLQTSTHRLESRNGGRDEAHGDVVDMVSFPGARRVTSTGTLSCTFLVDDNGISLKQSILPSSFNSYFNRLMLFFSYTNHLGY
jgi:hypothetical protein